MVSDERLNALRSLMQSIPAPLSVGAGFDPKDLKKMLHLNLVDVNTDGNELWMGINPAREKSLDQLQAIANVINLVHGMLADSAEPAKEQPPQETIESYLHSQLEIARQMTCEDDFEKGRYSGFHAAIVDCLDWLATRKENP